ncbi:DUF1254 domain-containing protein [Viscerimonas tarda]
MKTIKSLKILVILLALSGLAMSCSTKKELTKDEVVSLVREAYLYASPVIYTDVTRVFSPRPDNYLGHATKFPDHTFRNVVGPNNDTNYSSGFLELVDEPVVVEIPDTEGRYYVFPLQDAWTNNFALPGKRTTGTAAQKYLITGPNWEGEIPEGLTQIKSPTNLVWIIGRTQVNSKEDQEKFVTPLQKKYVLKPLSKWLSNDTTAVTGKRQYGNYLPENHEGETVVSVIKNLSIENFFNYFNELAVDNPPAAADSAIVARIAQVGVGAGKHFSLADFDKETQEALTHLTTDIYKELDGVWLDRDKGVTTETKAKVGDFGTDYYTRALVAYKGLGALPPEEAVYYPYTIDEDDEVLDGSKHSYILHFEKGQTPPAQAFWSYTIYGKDRYLTANPIKRYTLGDRSKLLYNKDGSLDIYLSHEAQPKDKFDNWLPIPADTFHLSLRIYLPREDFLKDRSLWQDPSPKKID